MIKILFFIETLNGGGAAKVLMSLVNAMDKTKFSITVQTLFKESASENLEQGIRYRYCYEKHNALDQLIARIESAVGLVYRLHIRDRYDIECAYLESLSTKIMAASNNSGALKCAWIHCDLEKMSQSPYKYVIKTRPWYSAFDKVICVSKGIQKVVQTMYENSLCSDVLYNTIDDQELLRKAEFQLPNDVQKHRLTILTVGTLYPPKNHMRLLRTCKRLIDEGLRFDLWVLGDGPNREDLEHFVCENGLQEFVHLWGFSANPYPFIKNADLLVCSSNYEGFSTFITEGLIIGKPIVTTDVSGMHELLDDSEYGLITENDDEAFYAGVKRMLTEPRLLEHYAERAKIRGRDFKCEKLAQETEHYLSQMLFEKRQHNK